MGSSSPTAWATASACKRTNGLAFRMQVDEVLPEGTALTIEPGVYLPGQFGVRIEDIVVLHAGGCDDLTASPKELIIL